MIYLKQAELDEYKAYKEEALRLRALVNTPEIDDFLRGVQLEAAHQVERHGAEHDDGKTPHEFFWLLCHLATRAVEHHKEAERLSVAMSSQQSAGLTLQASILGEHVTHHRAKARHHCITSAAVLFHWFARITGKPTAFRPGVSAETSKEIPR